MESTFNLRETVDMVVQASGAVIGHILFDAAIWGFVVAAVIASTGLILSSRKHRFSKPLLLAGRKLAIVCLVIAVPVLLVKSTFGLPDPGNYRGSWIGFLVWWSMVSMSLIGEEMNYQFWIKKDETERQSDESELDPSEVETSGPDRTSHVH